MTPTRTTGTATHVLKFFAFCAKSVTSPASIADICERPEVGGSMVSDSKWDISVRPERVYESTSGCKDALVSCGSPRYCGARGTRSASRIRVPNALRGPLEAAGRQGRRAVIAATS